MNREISVVILTSRGPRHSYFCRELAGCYQVRGIVVDDRYRAGNRLWNFLKDHRFNPFRMGRSLLLKRRLAPYEIRDREIEGRFFPQPEKNGIWPSGVSLLMSRDPNNEAARDWVRTLAPDVLVVFGTRLIQEPVLSLARFGALNIHTGLSPFYRGGQCAFWCLYEDDLDHLGVTIHHLSSKIDGGDIIYTAQPELEPGDTVRSIECKLVRLGTVRMIQAVRELVGGKAPRVPQRGKGRLFLSKMFTLEKRLALEKKLESGWLSRQLERKKKRVSV